MTIFPLRIFIRNYEKKEDPTVRAAIGSVSITVTE